MPDPESQTPLLSSSADAHPLPPEYTPLPEDSVSSNAQAPLTPSTATVNGANSSPHGVNIPSTTTNRSRGTAGGRSYRGYASDAMGSLFRYRFPSLPSSQTVRTAGPYTAGALFSLGFWFFIDASVYSKVNNPGDVHVKFVDWIPGICSALGMLVINSIEKSRLNADSFAYTGEGVAWKARLVLFLGFALMAGGLAGSVTVLIIKYIVPQYESETVYFGVANVVANSLIMLSSVVLWVSQNMEDDYSYHLTL